MGGYHQPVQKCYTGWRLKKGHDFWSLIDGILTRLPVLERRARNSDFFSQVTMTANRVLFDYCLKLSKLGGNLCA